MKTMAGENKGTGGGGGKAVEPAPPRQSLFGWLANAPEFFAQVRQEGAKVTWPTIQETRVTTIAVFMMILLAVVFFAVVDWVLSNGVRLILNAM